MRCNLERNLIDIVAINDPSPKETLAFLLKHDSVYGTLGNDISFDDGHLIIDGKKIVVTHERDPSLLPWKENKIDVVAECTGVFTDREGASKHLAAGARKVVISAPAKDPDVSIVLGVNDAMYDSSKHTIISNVSCTTNSLAPVLHVLQKEFGVENGLMTTIHSYTNDQAIVDGAHKDMRRARAAALSIIPTTTGAARAIGEIIPELKGKIAGGAVRVPTPIVSLTDLVVNLKKEVSVEEVNDAFTRYAEGELKGILGASDEPLVSMDFRKDPRSSIVDLLSTTVVGLAGESATGGATTDGMRGKTVKVLAWYDNEWGYSMRLLEVLKMVSV